MLRIAVRLILRVFYRLTFRGEVTIADRTVIVANHQSFLDAVILWAFLPRETTWIVHTQVARSRFFRLCLTQARHYLVDISSPYALKTAVGIVESGQPLVIFPEGRLTVTGSLMKVQEGTSFIACKAGAVVVPVRIDGAVHCRVFSRMSGDFPKRWFPRITVTVGEPRLIPMPEAPSGKERRRIAAETMRSILLEMEFASRPRHSLYEAFLDAVELHGRSRRMVEEPTGQTFTYGLLLKASLALGRLVSKFTAEGEAVGVLMPNVGATLSLLLGLFATRRIPAVLNYTAGPEGMQSALRASQARVLLTSRAFLERAKLGPAVDQLQGVRLIYLEDLRQTLTLRDKLWLVLYALRRPRRAMARVQPHEPAVVLFTSGSEGKPKGVVLSHENILSNIAQIRAMLPLHPSDRIMLAMPLFHSFGLTGGFLTPVTTGLRIFIYPTPLHYRLIPELIYDRDCTIVFATNTFLSHYARRAHPYDFRSLRYVVAGAEKLTDEVRRHYMDKFGVRIIEGYGATECSPVISANSPLGFRAGTVGRLVPGMEHRLEPVPAIEDGGLLHVKGPNVMLGYWREAHPGVLEPPSSYFGPGWYNTGDVVSIDRDGFITLVGRMKRFAKVAGEMVSLELVEKIAEAASPTAAHAATALPDQRRGEMIVLLTQDRDLRRERLQQAAQTLGAPELAIPRRVLFVEKIPLLGNGKKDYPAVLAIAQSLTLESAVAG